ncbi:MAG: hypothetical protein KZQ71_19535 [Candidatus Thiodiazotropha sp. (ex Lucinoma aequizonata)]|nr:hypothetical protein [Candidatus Thiodiazotropha sp. (ex Lucinoma aequizonata)]
MGKVEVVIQFYRDSDLPRLNPAILPITYLGEISHVWVTLKKEPNYSAKKLEKVLDKVFLYFFQFQRRLPTCINNHLHKQQEACYGFLL